MSKESAPAGTGRATGVEGALFGALIAAVALAPLPLGSNRPLPAAILALWTGGLLVIWAGCAGWGLARVAVAPAKLRLPLILFGLAALWILVQALPLPAGWGDPIWGVASEALGRPLRQTISVNPEKTLSGLMRLLSYAAVFWLALQLARDAQRARIAIVAVALIGTIYALYGIAVYTAGNEWILLYDKWAYKFTLTSTFVNRNSFATFAGLCLICATACFVGSFSHLLTIDRPLRHRIVMVAETIFSSSLHLTVATLALLLALVLTGSRAGVASSMAGLLVLMLALARRRRFGLRHAAAIAGLVGIVVLLAFALGGGLLADRISDRDATATNWEARSTVYERTMEAIGTVPWTGTGYGTFREVFAAYRPESLDLRRYWDKAHNTYLETMLELGIPAALLLNLSILLLAVETLRGLWRRRRDRTAPAIGVAATVLVGLHAVVDFSLQIPAVAILYAFIMGVAVSQSLSQERRGQAGTG